MRGATLADLYLPRAFDAEGLARNDRTVEERLAATNPNLAEAMRVSGLVQRYGVGIPIAHRVRCTVYVRPDWPGNVAGPLAVVRRREGGALATFAKAEDGEQRAG